MKKMCLVIVFQMLLSIVQLPVLAAPEEEWSARRQVSVEFTYENNDKYTHEMIYYLFYPAHYDKNQLYPLVVNLGPSGFYADPRVDNCIAEPLTRKDNLEKYPCFILVPKCPDSETWMEGNGVGAACNEDNLTTTNDELEMVVDLIEQTIRQYSIDKDRVYIYGFSNGASAVWSILGLRHDLFAAAIPVSGSTDVSIASKLVDVPTWAFHSMDDRGIPSVATRDMVDAIRQEGGFPQYTEYNYGSHVVTARVFNEPELFSWLFSQKKKALVEYRVPYKDIEKDSELYQAVVYLGKHGVLKEVNEQLAPTTEINLLDFLTLALKTSGYDLGEQPTRNWYNPYIKKAKSLGLITLDENVTSIDQKVTRELAASIVRKLFDKNKELNYSQYEESMVDYNLVKPEYRSDALTCYISGIMNGYDNQEFCPDIILTKGETLILCYRMMERGARTSPVDLSGDSRKTSQEVIGNTKYELVGERSTVRLKQTELGTLISSALMKGTSADLALMQGGGIRDSIGQGDITISNVYSVLPFDNIVTLIEMRGSQVLEALNNGYSKFPEENVSYPHVVGIDLTVNMKESPGNRVTINYIGKERFDPNKIYRVATNNYVSDGGDGYDVMKKCNLINSYGTIAEMLIDYITNYGANTYLFGQPTIKVVL